MLQCCCPNKPKRLCARFFSLTVVLCQWIHGIEYWIADIIEDIQLGFSRSGSGSLNLGLDKMALTSTYLQVQILLKYMVR
jgi:hypothetical protein